MNFYEVGDLVNNFKNNTKDNILPKDQIKYNKNGNMRSKQIKKRGTLNILI
jgi:hypothetical protein